jgi:hypothetical protein
MPESDALDALLPTLEAALASDGPAAAVARLCDSLREQGEYAKLFYARLMQNRVELGVSPIPTATNAMPAGVQAKHEEAIRSACREVGQLYLEAGNIPSAYTFYRTIGESQPVADAIAKYQPDEDDERLAATIEIAFHHGVAPDRGFDLIIERYGICRAISSACEVDPRQFPAIAEGCARKLVRSMHHQLFERLRTEIAAQQGFEPTGTTIAELVAGRDWLFADQMYLVDVSHLSSTVQLSLNIPNGEELKLARDLCSYGMKLAPMLQGEGAPPFDDLYADHAIYLGALIGDAVDEAIAHFRAKLDSDPDSSYPAEVLVNLLLRIGRPSDALLVAKAHLSQADERQMSCPTVYDLCQRVGDFATLAEVARERGDPVHFLAGLIAKGKP